MTSQNCRAGEKRWAARGYGGRLQSPGFGTEFTDSNSSPATTRSVVLKVEQVPGSLGALLTMHIAGPHPQSFVLFRSGLGPNHLRF